MNAAAVRAQFESARVARKAGDLANAQYHLTEAMHLAIASGQPELIGTASWRLAKLHWDRAQWSHVLDALDPALALDGAFAHYPQATDALERISAALCDQLGYGDPRLLTWWDAWVTAQAPERAYSGQVLAGWIHACRGDHHALGALLTAAKHWPLEAAAGARAHPLSQDPRQSMAHWRLDAAYAAACGALWAENATLAQRAREALEDALDDLASPTGPPFWVSECLGRISLRWSGSPAAVRDWQAALDTLAHPRAEFHRALGQGLLGPAEGRSSSLSHATRLATQGSLGPEWAADTLALRLGLGDGSAMQPLRALIEGAGLHAFQSRLQ